ncbi:MAG: hypothetical protein ABI880_01940, partial [Acidobacteriota bacterium]
LAMISSRSFRVLSLRGLRVFLITLQSLYLTRRLRRAFSLASEFLEHDERPVSFPHFHQIA